MQKANFPTRKEAEERLIAALPPRSNEGHKGSFGNALLYCGSPTYTGAALLAAMGALRAGAGITHLAAPEEVLLPVRIRLPEVICHPIPCLAQEPDALAAADDWVGRRGAILVGCGISRGDEVKSAAFCHALGELLAREGCPVVLDADALNMLSTSPNRTALLAGARRPLVLTPHPVEFARLTGLAVEDIQADRLGCAATFVKETEAVLLLKGHGTVVAAPDGSLTVNPTGSSALAKGGSGDVLAGVLVSLLACGMAPKEAAFAAAYLHGMAGDRLALRTSSYGVTPSDLPAAIAAELAHLSPASRETSDGGGDGDVEDF